MTGLLVFAVLAASLGCVSAAPSGNADRDSRRAFLASADRARARRDPKALAALADLEGWRKAGNRDLSELDLVLPAAPIARERERSETEVLYKDGESRSWRMWLTRNAGGEWRLVILARPCPPGGQRRQPLHEDTAPGARGGTSIWTPLECWPLPQ